MYRTKCAYDIGTNSQRHQRSSPKRSVEVRVWHTGSQGCEEVFVLLRSMTPTFSRIVNFSVKGILERIHKLNFLSSIECSDDITFPRVQRRLMQCKEENELTFQLCDLDEIENFVNMSRDKAINIASSCGMNLVGRLILTWWRGTHTS